MNAEQPPKVNWNNCKETLLASVVQAISKKKLWILVNFDKGICEKRSEKGMCFSDGQQTLMHNDHA